MTDEQNCAFLIAQSVVLYARIAGMQAENQWRIARGETIAYAEDAFLRVIDESPCHHNAAISQLRDG